MSDGEVRFGGCVFSYVGGILGGWCGGFLVGVFSVVPAGVSVVGVDPVVLLWFFCFFDLGVLPGLFDVEGKE